MKTQVYSIEGTAGKEVELPEMFNEKVRPDLINRAFLALRSNTYQIKATKLLAGMRTSAAYFGRRQKVYRTSMNIGRARLPKIKLSGGRLGEVRRVPHSRGGRRAHPPKAEKIIVEKINKKENRKAIRSAIAATASKNYVQKRGHKITSIKQLPLVIEDKFQEVNKTKQVREILSKLKVDEDMKRAENKNIRAGRGTTRGRKYKKKKSALIVINEDKGLRKAAKNIPGIDIKLTKELNAEVLAPGGNPGRLTIYTESSLKELNKLFK